MTSREQNEAIAKWMGWTKGQVTVLGSWISPEGLRDDPPSYTNDLNAIALAESKLRGLGGFVWTDYLRDLGLRDDILDMSNEDFWDVACAPARERAESLLRSLKLWKP